MTTTITPFLWYDDNAEEAIGLYSRLFPDARVIDENRGPDGSLFFATVELAGQRVFVMNGGPGHPHTDAFSFFVSVETQEEVDRLWDALTADGGEPGQCGWLKDKYGLSWQVVPPRLSELLSDPDPAKAGAVMQTMLPMGKLELAALEAAYNSA